jgi:hypothetical protein
MSKESIRRRALVLVLTLAAATPASPALARPLARWQQAWDVALAFLTPWRGREVEPPAPSKRGTTIGPDGIRVEPRECPTADGNQTPAPPGCGA